MYVSGLQLAHFRLYSQAVFRFTQPITMIIGDNAQGKTSVLEALELLSQGTSFRAGKIDELIQFDEELARIKAKVELGDNTTDDEMELELMLTRGEVQGKRTRKQHFTVNGVKRRKKDFVGKLLSSTFRPEDMRLVEGSPTRRRQYMDAVLSMVHYDYAQSLHTYEQTLKRRNKVLVSVREGEVPANTLHFWDQQLIKHGEIVQRFRAEFLGSFHQVDFPIDFDIEYQPKVISEERINQYKKRAIAAGHTLIGPHKDDFIVTLRSWRDSHVGQNDEPMSVMAYGSRGQQRLAVLWLKVCELRYIERKTAQKPLLLLDDVMSELDEESQAHVWELTKDRQTIITTTEPQLAESAPDPDQLQIISLPL